MKFFLKNLVFFSINFVLLFAVSCAANQQVKSEETSTKTILYLGLFTQNDASVKLSLDTRSIALKRAFGKYSSREKSFWNETNEVAMRGFEAKIEEIKSEESEKNRHSRYEHCREYKFNLIPFFNTNEPNLNTKTNKTISFSTIEIEAYSLVLPCIIVHMYLRLTDYVLDKNIVPSDQNLAEIVEFRLEDSSKMSSLVEEVRKIYNNSSIDSKYATFILFRYDNENQNVSQDGI